MIPLLSPCLHSEDEAAAVEAVWRIVSVVVAAARAAEVEVETFSLSIVVAVFDRGFPLLFHLYYLRLDLLLKLKLKLSEAVVEAEAAKARYFRPPMLSGWSCSRTPPRREPAIVVSSSCFSVSFFSNKVDSGGGFLCLGYFTRAAR